MSGIRIPGLKGDFILNEVIGDPPRMTSVYRYTGTPMHNKETIAEHSFGVAKLAGAIARKLKHLEPVRYVELDVALVYEMALYHDLPEVFASDIPAPFKLANKEFTDKYNDTVYRFMMDRIKDNKDPLYKYFYGLSNTDLTVYLEGKENIIVKIADILQLISFCYLEINMGNKHMIHIFENGILLLEECVENIYDMEFNQDLLKILNSTLKEINRNIIEEK